MVWRFRQASDLGIFALEVFKIILKERDIALFVFELFFKNL